MTENYYLKANFMITHAFDIIKFLRESYVYQCQFVWESRGLRFDRTETNKR